MKELDFIAVPLALIILVLFRWFKERHGEWSIKP
jgi:hypothetical protein